MPIDRISINIMAASVPIKMATSFHERTDKVTTLHTSTPNSIVWAPTCVGSESASSIIL